MTLIADGKVVAFFDMRLPKLVGVDNSIPDWAREFLQTGLQAVAAVFHQWVVEGNMFRCMPQIKIEQTRCLKESKP